MALVGDRKDLALVDIIQINCVGGNTARLTVDYPATRGVFYCQDGEIVDARIGNLTGIEAVYRALTMDEGSFRIDAGLTSPTRTVFEQWAGILMEGMRLLDEARKNAVSGSSVSHSQYQALVNDLVKVPGIEGALVATHDGTLRASTNMKAPDRMATLVAFHNSAAQVGLSSAAGRLQRVTIHNGDRKTVIIDQTEFLVALVYGAAQRDDVIEPQIRRAFKKLRARRSAGSMTMTPVSGPIP